MDQADLLNRYANRFYELIEEIQSKWNGSHIAGPHDEPHLISELEGLKTKIISLLDPILPPNHAHRKWMDELSKPEEFFKDISYYQNRYKWLLGRLNGLREDFEQGMLGELSLRIEAQIVEAYLDQASQLLAEIERNNFKHIPAAAIAGAVLERELYTICKVQKVAMSEGNENISSLVKKLGGYFDAHDHKQINEWRLIRNHVAHGRFNQVSKEEVEEMLIGLGQFFHKHLPSNQ
jgi:hypothetical protein